MSYYAKVGEFCKDWLAEPPLQFCEWLDNLIRKEKPNRPIKVEEHKATPNTRVLLLGTHQAGKSTFVKQILFLMREGVVDRSLQQRHLWKMKDNIVNGVIALTKKALEEDLIKETKEILHAIEALRQAEDVGPEEAEHIKFLWENEGIKEVWEKRLDSCLPTCLDYFLDAIERVSSPDYVMTPDDMLRVSVHSGSIQQYDIPPKGNERGWTFIDVGGMQSERRKWIYAFENVDAVLYFSSLDNYHMTLEENRTISRFEDDLYLFGEVIRTPYLPPRWIFFQNKRDLFEQQLKTFPLSNYFEIDKSREHDAKFGIEFIRRFFEEKLPEENNLMLTWHVTCGLDTKQFPQILRLLRVHIERSLGRLSDETKIGIVSEAIGSRAILILMVARYLEHR